MSDPRLCLALDVPTPAEAISWVERTHHVFGLYKIGLQLFCAEGPSIIEAVRRAGAPAIFLDLKLHDIPNTVAKAVASVSGLGVNYLTIHTGGGGPMMQAATEQAGDMVLLGVTVLTSLDGPTMQAVGIRPEPAAVATERALLARESGLGGLVCSAQEASTLKAATGGQLKLVTPGIRITAGQHDQKRVATPAAALEAGADVLVIGRAVTAADDLQSVLTHLQSLSIS
ncbi:MAG: orotidine-5'-phosphate decarboxylase [Bradymonadia bacterium]